MLIDRHPANKTRERIYHVFLLGLLSAYDDVRGKVTLPLEKLHYNRKRKQIASKVDIFWL